MIPVAATTRETFPARRTRHERENAKKRKGEESGTERETTDTAERTHGMEIYCSRERRLKTS